MRDLREVYPPAETESPYRQWSYKSYPDYDSLLESTGLTIVSQKTIGDYQGDYLMLVREEDRWGFLVVGYGSCSGCDALQACDTYEELDNLRRMIYNDTHWFDTATELADWMKEKDWALQWYWHSEESDKAIKSFVRRLRKEGAKE